MNQGKFKVKPKGPWIPKKVKDKAGNVSDEKTLTTMSAGSKNFDYTGGIQTFTIPGSGEYKLRVIGAGDGSTSKGGTAEGTKHFEQGDIIYIVVGGTGGNHEGGYNGGGAGFVGGGGATHMAQRSGVLSSLEANKSSVLLVAGGRWRSFERIL